MTVSPDLVPLPGVTNVRTAEAAAAPTNEVQVADSELIEMLITCDMVSLPRQITVESARAYARSKVGILQPTTIARLTNACWAGLSRATAPEVALSYERLIRQLTLAQGLANHADGKALAAQNAARAGEQVEIDREQRALARWAGKR